MTCTHQVLCSHDQGPNRGFPVCPVQVRMGPARPPGVAPLHPLLRREGVGFLSSRPPGGFRLMKAVGLPLEVSATHKMGA